MARIGRSIPLGALILRRPAPFSLLQTVTPTGISSGAAFGTPVITQPLSALVDDFSGDLSKWPNSFGGTSIIGGQASVPCIVTYAGLRSAVAYNFTNSNIFAKIIPGIGTDRVYYFAVTMPDDSNWAGIVIDNSLIYARIVQGGTTAWETWVPYNPVTHQWLAMSMSGTDVTWWESSDGASWTAIISHATTLPLSPVGVAFQCGYYGAGTVSTMYVDNVNVPGQLLSPSGIASTATVGTPTRTSTITVSPTGIAGTATLGTPTQTSQITVTPTGITSTAALGTPTRTSQITVTPTGIASTATVGTPTRTSTITVSPTGISSGVVFRNTEPYTRWFGQGVPNGTVLTTSVVGVGDTAFTEIQTIETPTVDNTDITFTTTAAASVARYLFAAADYRMIRWDLVMPTGLTSTLQHLWLTASGGISVGYINIGGSNTVIGQVRLNNPANVNNTVSAFAMTPGVRYTFQVMYGKTGGATNYLRASVYVHSTGALLGTVSTNTLVLPASGDGVLREIFLGGVFYSPTMPVTVGDIAYQTGAVTNPTEEIQWITTVNSSITVSPTGIASTAAVGTPTVVAGGGVQTVTPTGIISCAWVGTPVINPAGVWNGTIWHDNPEVWNGQAWRTDAEVWNGTSWVSL